MKKAGLVSSIFSLGLLLFILGCGHPTTLVSMSVTPATATVGPVGAVIPVQYTAYGNFIHPTETRDISSQVTWTSSVPMIATVSSTGLATPTGTACGTTTITAMADKKLIGGVHTTSSATLVATATFTVADSNVPGCPSN